MKYPTSKTTLITVALGLTLGLSGIAGASGTWEKHRAYSNASDKCHAWSPLATEQIRSRVAGIENVGPTTVAVACVYEVTEAYYNPGVIVDKVKIYFRNAPATPAATVACTLLPGNYVAGFGTAENKEVEVAGGSTASITYYGPWTAKGLGVNCNLPPSMTIAHSSFTYRTQDD